MKKVMIWVLSWCLIVSSISLPVSAAQIENIPENIVESLPESDIELETESEPEDEPGELEKWAGCAWIGFFFHIQDLELVHGA